MREVFLGDIIKRRRKELGLTQEELCEGICEPMTISRLENGKQTPTRNRINAILERLDLPADRYYALLSKNEIEVEALQKEIVALNVRFEQAVGEEKREIRKMTLREHRRLESLADVDDKLTRQFLLRSRIILGREEGPYSPEEQRKILLEAIRLTCPKFDFENIGNWIYTTDEIKIINQIANTYAEEKAHTSAITVYSQLYSYMEKRYRNSPTVRKHMAMVALNYAIQLDALKLFSKAIEIAEEGCRICLDYGHYLSLPGLLEVKAECFYFLGEEEKSKDLYFQAYYLCKAVRNDHDMEIIRKEVKAYTGITLI